MESIDLDFWHWFVIALALGILEMFIPGAAFLWLGLSAALVGLLMVIIPDLSLVGQVSVFACLAILLVVATRMLPKPTIGETDQPHLNQRTGKFIGRTLVLEGPIVNGRGRAHVNDTLWQVAGKDLPAGAAVRVTGADGTILLVEPIEES